MITELNQVLLGRINDIRVKGNFQTLHSKKSAVVKEMMKQIVREG